jgi:drug/metabolite transporter (DMT)-like permease
MLAEEVREEEAVWLGPCVAGRVPDAMPRTQERRGLLFAALCAATGAFVPAFAKLTTDRGEPFFVAAATTLFAGLFAASVLGVRGDLGFLVRRSTGPPLFIVGTLGTACAFLLFFYGARRTTAIEAVLCLQIEPAYSLLLSWIFLGHRPTLRRVAAIGVLLVGITLAVGGRGVSPSVGVWALLVTPLCWQVSHLIVLRRLSGVPPHVLTGARYVDGGILLALVWAVSGGVARLPVAAALAALLPLLALQGIILSYIGTLLWYQAITRLDLARSTAIVVPSIPILSLGASFVLLGEVPTAYQWGGLLLTAAGVSAFATAPHVMTARAGAVAAADKQLRPAV